MNKVTGSLLVVATIMVVMFCVEFARSQDNGYEHEYVHPTPVILNGDVNADGMWCIDDPVQTIYHLFRDGRELPCPDAADVDRSGTIDINDIVLGLRFLFSGDYIEQCPVTCDGGLHKTD